MFASVSVRYQSVKCSHFFVQLVNCFRLFLRFSVILVISSSISFTQMPGTPGALDGQLGQLGDELAVKLLEIYVWQTPFRVPEVR